MKSAVSLSLFLFGLAATMPFALPASESGALLAPRSSGAAASRPVNLKVLAGSDLTLRDVRAIMNDWTDQLGTACSTCHVHNTSSLRSNGRARYDYANDSKEEKRTARVMYSMTETINAQYMAKVPNSGVPVTCGTCHRGHLTPEPSINPETVSGR